MNPDPRPNVSLKRALPISSTLLAEAMNVSISTKWDGTS
jgi:hypothetical protein